jgi:uncharacterized SAM-binding protein YcdF (DUF218 family)
VKRSRPRTSAAGTLLIVHGHRDGNAVGGRPEISEECVARVRAAERAATACGSRHVLFCGAGADGHPSEAAQMARIWHGPPLELQLDERSSDSAENAHEAATWARALGARELVVVSSWWHLRLRLYYRGPALRGVAVRHVVAWRCDRIARHLWHELRYLPRVLI